MIPSLPVGAYVVTVEKIGFATHVRDGVVLTVDQAASLTVTLELGQVSQEVTVAAAAEVVGARDSTVGQLIDEQRVAELPLDGRRTQDLVFLSASTQNVTSRYCGFNCFGGVYPDEQRRRHQRQWGWRRLLYARRQLPQRHVSEYESALPEPRCGAGIPPSREQPERCTAARPAAS